MNKILIRYGEIYLKGHNRGAFERQLLANIKAKLAGIPHRTIRLSGRYLIEDYPPETEGRIVERLKKVFGIYSLSVARETGSALEEVRETALAMCPMSGTFKVETRRSDKQYPLRSPEISKEVGGFLLDRRPDLKVDLFHPAFIVNIEIREGGRAYVFAEILRGSGGLPVGSSGAGLLLLSGGIDSPVAGYMMAKRGMRITGLHFHSYPYTSELAREKVVSLAEILKEYTLSLRLNIVSFTEIQDAIHERCPEEYMVILMRRMMMRIANRICREQKLDAIVTGENLAQVASQTVESISVTNALAQYPVLRPVIGFDKEDIIDVARKIGTYETSIQPYEDCCTVFLPKHPVIKPRPERILAAEQALDVEGLTERAVHGKEILKG